MDCLHRSPKHFLAVAGSRRANCLHPVKAPLPPLQPQRLAPPAPQRPSQPPKGARACIRQGTWSFTPSRNGSSRFSHRTSHAFLLLPAPSQPFQHGLNCSRHMSACRPRKSKPSRSLEGPARHCCMTAFSSSVSTLTHCESQKISCSGCMWSQQRHSM